MPRLADESCSPCQGNSASVGEAEQTERLTQLPGWRVTTADDHPQLEKTFRFPNFVTALEFANRVGAIAEAANHHPRIVVEWGRVSVAWWTHSLQDLHHNDFVLAARTDSLLDHGGAVP